MNYFSKLLRPLIATIALVLLVSYAPPVFALASSNSPVANYAQTDQSTVVVKLKASSDAVLSGKGFITNNSQDNDSLNQALADNKVISKAPLIDDTLENVKSNHDHLSATIAANQGNLGDYYTLKLAPGETADVVAAKLKKLSSVETAYAKPLPAPAPLAPSYVSLQNYLQKAPTGMGVSATIGSSAKLYPGIGGGRIKFADLEYSWNTQHEDISHLRLANVLWANGTPVDPFSDNNHGTAVAGVVTADSNNGGGVNGTVSSVGFHMVNTNNAERGWDVANSIYTAANQMAAGDVMLIEQQAWAPDGLGFAPIEIYQDVYDAITYATAKGINVIEPAGNGHTSVSQGYNLSDPQFGGAFTTGRANSGAIIVGAGAAGCSSTPIHARMPFSNYGSRVDVQGYGECVATTGYGDLYNSSVNAMYTSRFNGTSSASATIAGVAAELSSSYKYTNTVAMKIAALKAALKTGGTAQNATVNAGNIGVLPNMASALKLTDITKPTAPTSLVGTQTSLNHTSLTWHASTDNLGWVSYVVYRNNVAIATVTTTSYTDNSVRSKTIFAYKIVAKDGSGNVSAASNVVSVQNK